MGLLDSIYEAVVGTASDAADGAGDALASMASEIVEQFDEGLLTFIEQAEALLAVDAGGVEAVNETLVALVVAILDAGDDVANRLAKLFAAWLDLVSDEVRAAADLVPRIFQALSSQSDALMTVLRIFVQGFSDFAALFRGLVARVLPDEHEYRQFCERVLLPLVGAALLAPGLGAEAVGKALATVLREDSPAFGGKKSIFDLGMPSAGLPNWGVDLLQSTPFRLRRVAWMVVLLLENLRTACGIAAAMPDGVAVPNPGMNALFQPLADWAGDIVTDYLDAVEELVTQVIAHLLNEADNDFELEWAILEVARFTPVGLLFVLVATSVKLVTSPLPFLHLVLNPIEDDPNLKVRRLPGPCDTVKYVVLSDVHRDPESDARPEFQPGSIDHFLENRELYGDLIRYYAKAGYTIIEAGDCEELWFHRDFSVRPAERMRDIIATHSDLYDLFADLHAKKRYFRVRGNHDSYLQDPDVLAELNAVMDPQGTYPFEVWDFLILEGVKSMHDIPLYLGLDSEPNEDRRPLIITHGHQWDFWNCDANNILGKLIVTAVVTPLDRLDDPLRDIGGISSFGSPLVNFKTILSELLVFSSWPGYEPAVRILDQTRHMLDEDRRFTDDIMYSETLASLMGLMIPVRPGPDDKCGVPFPGGRCLSNLMSLGHTHTPHNQPYYDLHDIPVVKDLLETAESAINNLTQGLVDTNLGLIKSYYLNTGVSGWYERCVWGIELGDLSHGTGQPKLVFWTHSTRPDRPNTMDWELPHRPRTGGAVPPGDMIHGPLKELIDRLKTMVGSAADLAGETAAGATEDGTNRLIGSLSAHISIQNVLEGVSKWKPVDVAVSFEKGGAGAAEAVQTLIAQLALGLLQTQRDGGVARFRTSVQIPEALYGALLRLESDLPVAKAVGADPIASAIGSLSVLREIGSRGFRRSSPALLPEWESEERSCLGVLLLLATLASGDSGRLSAKLTHGKGTSLEAELTIGRGDGLPVDASPPSTS